MFVARAPLRITLGGGGSDLTANGLCVTAAIDKYIYVAVHDRFDNDYLLKYFDTEHVKEPGDIRHPLLAKIIKATHLPPCEITVTADLPAGTGLGSSGAFTVATLAAVFEYQLRGITEERTLMDFARGLDTGWQDQASAIYGGVHLYGDQDGTIYKSDIRTDYTVLADNLLLFYTGVTRDSAEQIGRTTVDAATAVDQAKRTVQTLESGDWAAFADNLNAQWWHKRANNPQWINDLITYTRANGAHGAKLVGAGGGGFILCYTTSHAKLRAAMADYREVPFGIDMEGTVCHQI